MIYFLQDVVNWKSPKTDVEKEIAKGIADFRVKYYGEDTPKVVKLLDPRGKKITNVSGYYEPPKIFPIELIGGVQGDYRYTDRMPMKDKEGNPQFSDSRRHIKHILELKEDEIELAYFLVTYNNQIRNGRISILDDEVEATKIVAKEAENLGLRFYLFDPHSPIATNTDTLRSIAVTFGIPDVKIIGINQLKNRIFTAVLNGDNTKDRFVNTEMFMLLVDDDEKRGIAKIIYDAIDNKDLVYSNKDFAWHFSEGGEMGEVIFNVPGKDSAVSVQTLINACINKKELRKTVFGFLGKANVELALIRANNIKVLRAKCVEKEIKHNNNTPKEDLVKALCEKDGIEYEAPAPL